MSVTGTELACHVRAAFVNSAATRDRLLAYAAGSHARPEIIDLLHTLPDQTYLSLNDLLSVLAPTPAR
jgi:hypothetical protein